MGEVPAFLGTIPGWITAISSSGVFALAIFAVLRHLPEILRALTERRKQAFDEETILRGEKRDDLSDCKRRLDGMALEVEALKDAVRAFEMKLLGSITANKIYDAELEANLPASTALGQARAVLSAAFALSPIVPEDIANIIRPKPEKPL